MFTENSPLPLWPGVDRPFDKVSEVPLGLHVLSDARNFGPFLRRKTDHLLGFLLF